MEFTVTGIKADGTTQPIHKGAVLIEAKAEFKKALQQADKFASVHLAGPDGLDFRQATHQPKAPKPAPVAPPVSNPAS